MTAERWMRAADEDRETAVDVLRGAYAASPATARGVLRAH